MPITACVSVINNGVDSSEGGRAVMEAVHQCSAQGLQFTPGEHSPEHQERRSHQSKCERASAL